MEIIDVENKEIAIGTIFINVQDNVLLECIEVLDTKGACVDCHYKDVFCKNQTMKCDTDERMDKKSVIFKQRKLSKYITIMFKEKPDDKEFGIIFPDFQGCVSVATDFKHAKEMAQEALSLHVEGMLADKEKLPKPADCIVMDDHLEDGEIKITLFYTEVILK